MFFRRFYVFGVRMHIKTTLNPIMEIISYLVYA
jgi:hypothetical protein